MKKTNLTLILLVTFTTQPLYSNHWSTFFTNKKILAASGIVATVVTIFTAYWLTPEKKSRKNNSPKTTKTKNKTLFQKLLGLAPSEKQQPKNELDMIIDTLAEIINNQSLAFHQQESKIETVLANQDLSKLYQNAQKYDKKNKTKIAQEIQFYIARNATQNSKI